MTTKREQAKAERRLRIVQAARDLIRETGNTDLSMRALAERAEVSLATPYNLFGSKRAIVLAVLEDERAFNEQFASFSSNNSLERILDALRIATEFYTADPEFYRTLWQTLLDSSGKSDSGLSSPERLSQSQAFWRSLIEAAQQDGYIEKTLNIDVLQSILAISMGGLLLGWATGEIRSVHLVPSALLAFTLTLNGVATPKARKLLTPKAAELQALLVTAPARTKKGRKTA